ncbi:YopX family protein [Campylobacter coli]|uniref:YopX family protein n=1 Tax=Campylobacter coli TaxID=195 RepID=UPI0011A74BCD|nr:YopX family protein [Campylobacter coli]
MKLSDFDFRIYDIGNEYYMEPKFAFRDEVGSEIDNYEIELFTGLYDKGGVKIFEGDILNFRGKNYLVKMNKELKTIIICESKDIVMHISKGNLKECKVIGNIHENEEILKDI